MDPSPAHISKFSLTGLAERLSSQGIGERSSMLSESVFQSHQSSTDLPEVHTTEGAKFSKMAWRVAPPEIVAEYIRTRSSWLPIAEPFSVTNAFDALTSPPIVRGSAVASDEKIRAYLAFSQNDPSLLLSCYYLSRTMEAFARELAAEISEKKIRKDVEKLANHFVTRNLMTALPYSVFCSLKQSHGKEASVVDVDEQVVRNALSFLHDHGLFRISAVGMVDTPMAGQRIILQCPMEGYVFELLDRRCALQPVIDATLRANQIINDFEREIPLAQEDVEILDTHNRNMSGVSLVAGALLSNFDDRAKQKF